jgi:integrase/recombinase XerD
MPQKLETVLKHVEEISNSVNRQLIYEYHKYLVSRDTSTNYQEDNVRLIYMFAKFLGTSETFKDVKDTETIIAFLDTRRKSKEEDPEQKWITTWNDYLWRIKMFYRWLYNVKLNENRYQTQYYDIKNWIIPDFVCINKKKTKRLSPYNEADIWDKEDIIITENN